MTKDEINVNYRNSDWQRWQSMDFVVGIKINRSNHQPQNECEWCERLQGEYPKTFRWHGWCDCCRCYAVPITNKASNDDRVARLRAALHGLPYTPKENENTIKYVPRNFVDWFLENRSKFNDEGAMPYFVTENMDLIIDSYQYYKCQDNNK